MGNDKTQSNDVNAELAYSEDLIYKGLKVLVSVNLTQRPGLAIVGNSGSGKSYFLRRFLAALESKYPDAIVYVLDFKNVDYAFASGSKNLFVYDKTKDGLNQFYETFHMRLKGEDNSRTPRIIIIEEMASMLSFYDKKTAEVMKSQIAEIILMGRALGVIAIISSQRLDAELFKNSGIRDSISTTIALGNISEISKEMIAPGLKHLMKDYRARGSGYLITDNGTKVFKIVVPELKKPKLVEKKIIDLLNR